MEKTKRDKQYSYCFRTGCLFIRMIRLFLLTGACVSATGLANGIIYVDDDNQAGPWDGSADHPYRYIQDAVGAAGDGSEIIVFPGLYTENVVINDQDVYLASALQDDPNAAQVTVIDAGQAGHALRILNAQVIIEGLGLANGLAGNGAGLFCSNSQVSMLRTVLSNNRTPDGVDGPVGEPGGTGGSSGNGGGIFCLSSSLHMDDCEIRESATGHGGRGGDGDPYEGGDGGRSGHGGGLYALYSTVEMNGCTFVRNATGQGGTGGDSDGFSGSGGVSGSGGGSYFQDCTVVLRSCRFEDNGTGTGGDAGQGDHGLGNESGSGGGLFADGGMLTIEQCTFSGNATGDGGIAGYVVYGGNSGDGGGVCVRDCDFPVFSGCRFEENVTGEGGTGWWPGGSGGFGGDGGGVSAVGGQTIALEQCVFANNESGDGGGGEFGGGGGRGGGLFAEGQYCNLSGCVFTSNRSGDAIWAYEYAEAGGDGGGAMIDAPLATMSACIFSQNVTGDAYFNRGGNGGGILCTEDVGAVHCLIVDNVTGGGYAADRAGNGGGIYAGGDLAMAYCTVSGNTAGLMSGAWGSGGGLWCGALADIESSILWSNYEGEVFDETSQFRALLHEITFSCIQDWAGGIGNIASNPLFARTEFPGQDYHLKSQHGRWDANARVWVYDDVTSPCIDAGDPAACDWVSELWPHGERVNMGAYGGTAQASLSPSLQGNPADVTRDGCVGPADLMRIVSRWLMQQELLSEDVNRDGAVDCGDFAVLAEQWASFAGYDLAGFWRFDESSGSTAFDASAYHNDGLLVNSPQRTGGAVSFDGIDDYIEVPHSDSLNLDRGMTLAVRIYLTAYGTNWPKLAVKPHSAYADPWEMFALDLGHYGTSPRFLITDGTPGGQTAIVFDNAVTLSLNRWYHIAGTYDGSTLSLYVDGEPVASVSASFSVGANTMPLSIGGRLGANSFQGLIDDVRLYNRPLSSDEIGALHDSFNPGQGG